LEIIIKLIVYSIDVNALWDIISHISSIPALCNVGGFKNGLAPTIENIEMEGNAAIAEGIEQVV
jgi:hypothetical protein